MRKYIAELIGTFGLTLIVILSLSSSSFPVPTPFLAALTLTMFVYSIGNISGSHINPAVTLGLLAIGKVDPRDAVFYIVAQFIGAAAAIGLSQMLGVLLPVSGVGTDSSILFAESVGAFFFTFGIASVASGRVSDAAGGITVGGSLLLGIALAVIIGSAGVLNPAVAFGLGLFGVPYVVGPVLGSVIGMTVFRLLDVAPSSRKQAR